MREEPIDYSELPEKVRDMMGQEYADFWESPDADVSHNVAAFDFTKIDVIRCDCCDEELYNVPLDGPCYICGSPECFVDKWGDESHVEFVDDWGYYYMSMTGETVHMCGPCRENFNGDSETIVLTNPETRERYMYQYVKPVIGDEGFFDQPKGEGWPLVDADDNPYHELMMNLIRGSGSYRIDGWRSVGTSPRESGEFVKAMSGWHSGMEPSEQQERINKLSNGLAPLNEKYPVAVVHHRGSNVCVVNMSIYTVEDAVSEMVDYLDVPAKPGHGGLRKV